MKKINSNTRRPLLVVLIICTLAGTIWWSSQPTKIDNPTAEHAITPPKAVTPPEKKSRNKRPSLEHKQLASPRSIATLKTPKSQLTRGNNNTLTFQKPRVIKRKTIPGKIFTESLLHLKPLPLKGHLSLSDHSISAVEAAYDVSLVRRFIQSDAELIRVPLDADQSALVKVKRLLSRGPETYTLTGQVEDDTFSDVLLVFHDGAISGSIAFYNKNIHYEYGMAGNGDVAIRRLDPKSFTAKCENPGSPLHEEKEELQEQAQPSPPTSEESIQSPQAEAPNVVTMTTVVGYSIGAKTTAGGLAAIEARIIASVARMNTAFENSQITNTEVVLLGTVEDPSYVFGGSTPGKMSDELIHLNNETDGFLDTVSNLRISLGADHNAFVLKSADGSGGIAFNPGKAMIVALDYMTSTTITFAHEFGHSIGCYHAWGDTSAEVNKTRHNYGWRIAPENSGKVRSIMSYDWDWTRIPYYSNPNVLYNGAKTGAVDGYDATDDATTDPRFVLNGKIGTAGAGYDGTNPSLGARNADYIQLNAPFVADNAVTKTAPKISISASATPGSLSNSSILFLNAPFTGVPFTETLSITNSGTAFLNSLAISIDGTNVSDYSISSLSVTELAPGASTTFEVTYLPSSSASNSINLHITSNDVDNSPFDLILTGIVRPLITSEDFENGFGSWSSTSDLDFDWTSNSDSTRSDDTGPNTASSGSTYIYTESSDLNYPSKKGAVHQGFDFSNVTNILLQFDYHMYGAAMGTLSVDVFDGSSWDLEVWSKTGQQHANGDSAWTTASIDLSAYNNKSGVIIRIIGETGTSYTSDMAIDNINVYGYGYKHSYSAWIAAKGLTGNDAAPETILHNDGIANLLKFAFNLSSDKPDTHVFTPTTGTSGLPVLTSDVNNPNSPIKLEFPRRKFSNITYTLQQSTTLNSTSWTNVNSPVTEIISIDDEWERVIITLPDSEQTHRFYRVDIQVQ